MEPDIVKYGENNKPQYDLILGTKTMKEFGIILDFKDNMITIDEVKLPMQKLVTMMSMIMSPLKVLGVLIK